MAFISIRVWTWRHFFAGEMSVQAELGVTEGQVRRYIAQLPSRGGNGNYALDSLASRVIKIKTSKSNVVLWTAAATTPAPQEP